MSEHTDTSPHTDTGPPPDVSSTPPDVSLLLRAHAEQHWLSREVIPVVRQIENRELRVENRERRDGGREHLIETRELPEEQLPAALAYLEVIWAEAARRALETERARRRLEKPIAAEQPLRARANRYHAILLVLRDAVARRVGVLLGIPVETREATRAHRVLQHDLSAG
jgi:hypothetical protein